MIITLKSADFSASNIGSIYHVKYDGGNTSAWTLTNNMDSYFRIVQFSANELLHSITVTGQDGTTPGYALLDSTSKIIKCGMLNMNDGSAVTTIIDYKVPTNATLYVGGEDYSTMYYYSPPEDYSGRIYPMNTFKANLATEGNTVALGPFTAMAMRVTVKSL